jgi:hypothetical protein
MYSVFRVQRAQRNFLQLIAVVPEKVVHRLNANADGSQRTVLVQVAEGEVRLAGLLDDLLNDSVDEGIVAALEIG